MKNWVIGTLVGLSLATSAAAQSVNECDWVSSARNLVTPWEENYRDFANGAIRVALLDTYEPACCSFHLLVLSPHPEWGQACHVVSMAPGQGWVRVQFMNLKASYDPSLGLRVNIDVDHYDPETGTADPSRRERIGVRINQASGSVTLE